MRHLIPVLALLAIGGLIWYAVTTAQQCPDGKCPMPAPVVPAPAPVVPDPKPEPKPRPRPRPCPPSGASVDAAGKDCCTCGGDKKQCICANCGCRPCK